MNPCLKRLHSFSSFSPMFFRPFTIGASLCWPPIYPNIWTMCCTSLFKTMAFTHRCHTYSNWCWRWWLASWAIGLHERVIWTQQIHEKCSPHLVCQSIAQCQFLAYLIENLSIPVWCDILHCHFTGRLQQSDGCGVSHTFGRFAEHENVGNQCEHPWFGTKLCKHFSSHRQWHRIIYRHSSAIFHWSHDSKCTYFDFIPPIGRFDKYLNVPTDPSKWMAWCILVHIRLVPAGINCLRAVWISWNSILEWTTARAMWDWKRS